MVKESARKYNGVTQSKGDFLNIGPASVGFVDKGNSLTGIGREAHIAGETENNSKKVILTSNTLTNPGIIREGLTRARTASITRRSKRDECPLGGGGQLESITNK